MKQTLGSLTEITYTSLLIFSVLSLFTCNSKSFLCAIADEVSVDSKVVTKLSNSEKVDGFLSHAGFLWVGKSIPKNILELFAPGRAVPTTIGLRHTPLSIKPYGKDSVFVLGKFLSKENVTHYGYSIVKLRAVGDASGAEVVFKELSPELHATAVCANQNNIYFADAGLGQVVSYKPVYAKDGELLPEYKPADEEEETDLENVLKVEAPGSFVVNKLDLSIKNATDERAIKRDTQQFSFPRSIVEKAGFLFIDEGREPRPDDDNVARVPAVGGKVERVFARNLKGLTQILALDDSFPYVVAIESLKRTIHFIDAWSKTVVRQLAINDGEPRSVAQLGKCLVALVDKKVEFFEISSKSNSPVKIWDLSQYGFLLDYPRDVTVDPISKQVYVRSKRDCSQCEAESNGIVEAHETPVPQTFDFCLSN